MLNRWGPATVLALLALVFFWPLVLHPSWVLYSESSDLLAEHVPAKRFLVRSFQADGELPLWCPWQFSGAPFVHDIQVAIFYPPHLALLALPEDWVGPALSWLVVLHVLLAGLTMYAYARHRGLLPFAALVAAAGYMFAGRWMLHLLAGGHYITIGLAWLPLVLLALDRAVRRGSLLWATAAGLAFALLVLCTQPQWTFYAGLFVALSTLGTALEEAGHLGGTGERSRARTGRALGRWLGFGAWAAGLAIALSAVQLLPTLEAALHSSRAAGIAPEYPEESLRTLLFLVGPSLIGGVNFLMWEDRGGLSLLWLIAAVLAPLLRNGPVRYQAGLCVGMLVLGASGAFASRWVPGLNLFRQHPRVLLIASLPIAYLAGVTTQALFLGAGPSPERRRLCVAVALAVGAFAFLAPAGVALGRYLLDIRLRFDSYWLFMPLFFALALPLLGGGPGRRRALLWGGLLLADLWALTWPQVEARPEEEVFPRSASVRFLADRRGTGRVLDIDHEEAEGPAVGSPLGQGSPMALLEELESVRGFNPIDVLHYREYLSFIAGVGRPLRALDSAVTQPLPDSFPLVNRRLLDQLGVRYLLHPSAATPPGDGWRALMVDPRPAGYSLAAGDVQDLPPYTVSENGQAFPRAFVVPRAAPLPPRPEILGALKRTDLRQTVLLAGHEGEVDGSGDAGLRPATITAYRPNRVVVRVEGDAPGFLVLTDVWYPGWGCTVDGEPAPLYRANNAFRGVAVPAGAHEVVFRFEPESYRRGRAITLGSLAAVPVLLALLAARELRRRRLGGERPA